MDKKQAQFVIDTHEYVRAIALLILELSDKLEEIELPVDEARHVIGDFNGEDPRYDEKYEALYEESESNARFTAKSILKDMIKNLA